MMATLTRMIEQLAALLVTMGMGIPAGQSILYVWILLYLLVTGCLGGLLIFILFRRRRQQMRIPPSDLES